MRTPQKIQVRRAFRPQGSGFGVRTEMVGNRRLGKQSKPVIQSVTHPTPAATDS